MLTNNNLHIIRISYKTETEVKQAVRKKMNKKRYVYSLTVSLSKTQIQNHILDNIKKHFFNKTLNIAHKLY